MRTGLTRALLLVGCAALPLGCGGEDVSERPPEERPAVDDEVERLRAENAQLEREVDLHERREKHAEDAAERARKALEQANAAADDPSDDTAAPDEGPAEEPWVTRVKAYPAYEFEEFDEALGGVDWVTVGGNMSAMPALIAQLGDAIAAGKPMEELPADLVGRIQQLNGPLVTAALTIMQKGVPGTGANGSFSHPSFMANAIAASLEAVGLPLSEEQASSLEDLVRDFARRDAERIAGLDESAGVLEQLLSESDLRRDYFERVYALLTQEQHETLRPPATRGRLQLDIFCESLMWTGRAGPLGFTDRADLAEKVAGWITSRASLASQDPVAVREIVDHWVEGLPDDVLAWDVDRLSESGMMQVEHVQESARAVRALQTALIDGLALDEAGIAGVRAVPGSVVFYRRPPE